MKKDVFTEIVWLRTQGMTVDEIAAETEIGRDEVAKALKHAARCIRGVHLDQQRTAKAQRRTDSGAKQCDEKHGDGRATIG